MYARSAGAPPFPGARLATTLGNFARGALAILCIAAVAASFLAVRSVVFEYTHGDQQIVHRLAESLLP